MYRFRHPLDIARTSLPGMSESASFLWNSYDPTNGTIGGRNLIRVAATRDISQAVPISGTFVGAPGEYLGLTVDVSVVAE